jgi:hypothetical protein
VVYAKDAMNGLDLANQLQDDAKRDQLAVRTRPRGEQLASGGTAAPVIEPGRTFTKASSATTFRSRSRPISSCTSSTTTISTRSSSTSTR